MAVATSKSQCFICVKEKATAKCSGCGNEFCFKHLLEHRQDLGKEFDDLETRQNHFQQILTEQNTNPRDHLLLEEINQWETESIEKVRKIAGEARQLLIECMNEKLNEIKIGMSKLTEELKEIRRENNFTEIDIIEFQQKLGDLEKKFRKSSNLLLEKEQSEFIGRISIIDLSRTSISMNRKWEQNGITVASGKGHGVYVDQNETIYVADERKHRIVAWKKGSTTGKKVAGGMGQGSENSQLNSPLHAIVDKQNDYLFVSDSRNKRVVRWSLRYYSSGGTILSDISCYGLAMDNDGYLYVTDLDRDEVRRYKIGETIGTIVAGGNGRGNRLDQLNSPSFIFVDQDQSVYVSDTCNHRVMKWVKDTKTGIIVAGGNGEGSTSKQFVYPRGIFVDEIGCVYVVDCGNNRIMQWEQGAQEGTVIIGGNGLGSQANQLNIPIGLYCDDERNFYVVDSGNNRVQKFSVDLY